jgi:hypothetical protein
MDAQPAWLPCNTNVAALTIDDFKDSADRNLGVCVALACSIIIAEGAFIWVLLLLLRSLFN